MRSTNPLAILAIYWRKGSYFFLCFTSILLCYRTCKKVYILNTKIFQLLYLISLYHFTTSNTLYYEYITLLNHFETNLFYICMYIYSITINLFKLFSFFFFKFYLSISLCEELIPSRVLVVTLIAGTVLIHPVAFYFFMIIFFFQFFKLNNYLILTYLRLQRVLIIYFLAITLSLGGF